MKIRLLALGVSLTIGLMASSAQAKDCGEVSITEMDWASASVVTAVAKFLMEEGYGCKVTTVPSASIPALASLAETGEPDILTEIWTNGAPAYDGLVKSGQIEPLTNVLSDGGLEAWWIPDYLAEKHPELKTLAGIKANPELVGGRFHNCPEGWTCKYVNTNMAKAADFTGSGLEDFIHGSGETLAASLASAYANKQPWFGYYWGPSSVLGKYSMTMVDIGGHSPEGHKCNSNKDCTSPMTGAFPKSIVTTVVSKAFFEGNKPVTDLMRNLSFTNKQMGTVLAWKEENKASADEAAVYFLTNNTDVWSKWLNDDARENLKALLK